MPVTMLISSTCTTIFAILMTITIMVQSERQKRLYDRVLPANIITPSPNHDIIITGETQIKQGEDLHLTCHYSGPKDKVINYKWKFESYDTFNRFGLLHGIQHPISTGVNFTKTNMQSSDAGIYSCRAMTKFHIRTGNVKVHVLGKNGVKLGNDPMNNPPEKEGDGNTHYVDDKGSIRRKENVFEEDAVTGVVAVATVIGIVSVAMGIAAFLYQRKRVGKPETGEHEVMLEEMGMKESEQDLSDK